MPDRNCGFIGAGEINAGSLAERQDRRREWLWMYTMGFRWIRPWRMDWLLS